MKFSCKKYKKENVKNVNKKNNNCFHKDRTMIVIVGKNNDYYRGKKMIIVYRGKKTFRVVFFTKRMF